MQNNLPFVSVIVPCKNEEKFIRQCLGSIIENDYLRDRLEIMVIDGMSENGTREIIQSYIQDFLFVRILDNPNLTKPEPKRKTLKLKKLEFSKTLWNPHE